jgi:hypothetical protein
MRSLLTLGIAALVALCAASAALATGVHFRSPSGNIRCSITTRDDVPVAGCVTLRPRRTADVFDGQAAHLGTASRHGPARYGFVLSYGNRIQRFGFRCTSRFRGVTCSDLGTGRGFTICAEGANTFPGGRPTPCRATPSGGGGGGGAAPPKPPRTTPRPSCSPSYSPCVPNVPGDLDCADIGFTVSVIGPDVYRLDGDGDGIGCESE